VYPKPKLSSQKHEQARGGGSCLHGRRRHRLKKRSDRLIDTQAAAIETGQTSSFDDLLACARS
jgi:hypothetical protein